MDTLIYALALIGLVWFHAWDLRQGNAHQQLQQELEKDEEEKQRFWTQGQLERSGEVSGLLKGTIFGVFSVLFIQSL